MSGKITRSVLLLIFAVALCVPTNLLAAMDVNVNTATMEQLQQIKGIGPKTAEKIVSYRETHGQFSKVSDLSNIKGIGDKSLEKMASHISVE